MLGVATNGRLEGYSTFTHRADKSLLETNDNNKVDEYKRRKKSMRDQRLLSRYRDSQSDKVKVNKGKQNV